MPSSTDDRQDEDTHARAFADAIRAALKEPQGDATRLERVAETLVGLAIDGNMAAIREISERLDGKAGAAARGHAEKPAAEPFEVRVKWLKD